MGDHPKGIDPATLPSLHSTIAQNVLGSDFKPGAVLHSYKKSFNGFVIKLTEDEAQTLAEMENVVSVFPNTKHYPSTTKSWDFIGLPQNSKRMSLESDIIVGVLDTGIWPESKSFRDEGFGPPPKKWKGSCHNFTCNNKLIGARYYNIQGFYSKRDMKGPRDANGHGTHCASTIAGNMVNNVSLEGYASGTARGGVPSARIAVYKVCWEAGFCNDVDILAAFDEAIADGVDVLSVSVGQKQVTPLNQYFQNSINIGSFHAMQRGIFTSNAANNLGPDLFTMTNYPPWLLSVAASTFGRKFVTKVQLGNGAIYEPDIAAPGVNVIAAWTLLDPISEFEDDKRRLPYNIMSGTSMACPHAAAVAAYVKSFHPNWSPAMIKSALMTTATPMSPSINPEAEFAYGAGLISPVKATNPGLVYDMSEADYVEFLCGEGYTDKQLVNLTRYKSDCKGKGNGKAVYKLNLPSFALEVNDTFSGYVYHRTVTNVGSAKSTYKARVISSPLLEIQVKPDVLSFTSIGQKKSFSLTIEGDVNVGIMSSSLIWDDGKYQVRSPITYIVYMGAHPKGMDPTTLPSLHSKIAQSILGSDFEPGAVLHSYHKSFNGFVVKLTEDEAETLAEMDDVVSVFPNTKNRLHTTKSWDFIGLPQNIERMSLESDVIVGVIDTGIWPESKSFSYEGFGPPPKKWKGTCHNFTCNNKIIGARYFNIEGKYGKKDIKSPRDVNGHGSHCASTVAGNMVSSVSLEGYASGTARGGVPSARIAVYKVCWEEAGCEEADILAAFDSAIADGVDVLSVSLGSTQVSPLTQYFQHSINIGSFHAMQKGVLTSNSANNLGPDLFTMTNYPPWLLSVAASTFGRKFVTKVKLGNGKVYEGSTINTLDLKNKMFPIVFARDIPNTAGGFNSSVSRFCNKDSVDEHAVKGKIVLCEGIKIPTDVGFFSGAAGPDIAAPGVNVIAAWTPLDPISEFEDDNRRLPYQIISGTSMACPHAAAAAAYVKSFHPNWSPAMIKSALMTTATPMSPSINPEAEFAYGAGLISPVKATNPGLVYDMSEADYVEFLCGEGYTDKQLVNLTRYKSDCKGKANGKAVYKLNLPSFALEVNDTFSGYVYHRTVTNVGSAKSSYKARVISPPLMEIQVKPDVLSFTYIGQKKSFSLTIEGDVNVGIMSSSLIWDDGKYQVRSPIVVYGS
ncbi:hypothetical protein RYX36_006270 [Vicia faba]